MSERDCRWDCRTIVIKVEDTRLGLGATAVFVGVGAAIGSLAGPLGGVGGAILGAAVAGLSREMIK